MKETSNPFSLAVFNGLLYWSDAKKRVVLAAHKTSGKNRQVLLKRPRQPFGVKVSKMFRIEDVQVQVEMGQVWYNRDPVAKLGSLHMSEVLTAACQTAHAQLCHCLFKDFHFIDLIWHSFRK